MSNLNPGKASPSGGVWQAYVERRHTILFYSLLFTILAGPLAATLELDGRLIELALGINLLAAVLPMSQRRNALLVFSGLLAAALLARLGTLWSDDRIFPAFSLGFWSLLALLAAASALKFAVQSPTIDREHVYAALSAYLLAGVFFGVLYWVLEQLQAGSLTFTGDFSRVSAIYFSFVTLATLGYGDIAPRADLARGLAIIEGIGGQLFLAVFVARLIGLYGQRKKQS